MSVGALVLTFLVSKDLGRDKQQIASGVKTAGDSSIEESQPLALFNEVDEFLEENDTK